MEVRGGEIGTQVSAMPPNGAVFHQAVLEEHLLASNDVIPGKERFPSRADDPCRDWWGIRVAPDGDPDEDREPQHENENCGIAPPR